MATSSGLDPFPGLSQRGEGELVRLGVSQPLTYSNLPDFPAVMQGKLCLE